MPSSKEAETIKEAESSKEPETSSNSKLMTSAIFMCCICTIAVDETVVSSCAPTPSPPLCDYTYLLEGLKEEDFFEVASPGVVRRTFSKLLHLVLLHVYVLHRQQQ